MGDKCRDNWPCQTRSPYLPLSPRGVANIREKDDGLDEIDNDKYVTATCHLAHEGTDIRRFFYTPSVFTLFGRKRGLSGRF